MNNKGLKELLVKIEGQLNKREQWEIENGVWLYKFNIKKNEIEVKVYDSEIDEDYLFYSFAVDIEEDAVSLIKSMITYLYSNEVNYRQSYLKGDKGYYNRKHRSLALWLKRGRLDKVQAIGVDIAKRYKESECNDSKVKTYKEFISDFYSCLYELEPNWKIVEVKEAILAKVKELNVKNIYISSIKDKVVVAKLDDTAENIVDKFEVEIEAHSNKNAIANQVITKLSMEDVA